MEKIKKRNYYFKYMKIEGAKDIISSNQVKFSHPKTFNDPFDIQYDPFYPFSKDELAGALEKRIFSVLNHGSGFGKKNPHEASLAFVERLKQIRKKIQSGKTNIQNEMEFYKNNTPVYLDALFEEFETTKAKNRKLVNDVGVLCLAEEPDNILMWSHYGEYHKGVVLGFKPQMGKDSFFDIIYPVSYRQELPIIQTLDGFLDEIFGVKKPNNDHLYLELLTTKSKHWSYEKEWRVVAPGRLNGSKTHEFVFLLEGDIDQIILGFKMPEHEKNEIKSLCKKFQPQAKILQATKHDRKFELVFEPI